MTATIIALPVRTCDGVLVFEHLHPSKNLGCDLEPGHEVSLCHALLGGSDVFWRKADAVEVER